jgi:PTH1 family peptidyl-tRNA hydrolase
MPAPRLIVGLGNPGSEYRDTRHNLGFRFIDRLAGELATALATQARFHGIAGRHGSQWLLKPATFMNRSGLAVSSLACFYKIPPDEILVIHDDLDLPPGTVRVKQGGGSGGHNGVSDIQAHLGTPAFWRLRLGIGHPGERHEVIGYVLKAPRREEQDPIERAIDRCLLAWPKLGAGDYAAAQRALHGKEQNAVQHEDTETRGKP